MLLALIIKRFQKMWPKLGRRQSWRVSMHAPFGNFAWAPHHCRGARGGYESLLHPRVTWRFLHLLASGCAFPVLLNSSWYIITNVPFLLSVNTKNTPLEGGCGKQTSEWDHQRGSVQQCRASCAGRACSTRHSSLGTAQLAAPGCEVQGLARK